MIRFDYTLTGTGWAEATIADDRSYATVTASYLSDALGDLLDAVGVLLEGVVGARCSWEEEPGEVRWIFKRHGDLVHLRLLGFQDVYSRQPDNVGYVIFDTTQPIKELSVSVADAAQAVLEEYGPDGYLEKWVEHPFPAERLSTIRAHLAG